MSHIRCKTHDSEKLFIAGLYDLSMRGSCEWHTHVSYYHMPSSKVPAPANTLYWKDNCTHIAYGHLWLWGEPLPWRGIGWFRRCSHVRQRFFGSGLSFVTPLFTATAIYIMAFINPIYASWRVRHTAARGQWDGHGISAYKALELLRNVMCLPLHSELLHIVSTTSERVIYLASYEPDAFTGRVICMHLIGY